MYMAVRDVNNITNLGSMVTVTGKGGLSCCLKNTESKISIYEVERNLEKYDSNVKSALLFGCESWTVIKVIAKKLESFIYSCH